MYLLERPTGAGVRRGARRRWATASAVLAVAAVSGCGSSEQPKMEVFDPAAVTSSPTPSPTTSETDAIVAAYREFFARQTEISAAPKEQRRSLLEPFTVDPALNRVLRGMFAAEDIGEVGYGTPVLAPSVEKIDGDSATVTDCQDTSESGRKKLDGGKITTRGVKNAKAVVTLKRGPEGRWRVSTVAYPDERCTR